MQGMLGAPWHWRKCWVLYLGRPSQGSKFRCRWGVLEEAPPGTSAHRRCPALVTVICRLGAHGPRDSTSSDIGSVRTHVRTALHSPVAAFCFPFWWGSKWKPDRRQMQRSFQKEKVEAPKAPCVPMTCEAS